MSRKLNKALREQKQNTQQVPQEIYGTLLAINGLVEVKDRPSFVNVQLRDNQNEIIQAFNNKVAASPDLPVIVHREGNRYVIQGVNTQRYQSNWNNYAPYLPKHGTSHSFADGGGGDISWIFSRQFMPNLVYPDGGGTTGSSAFIAPHILLTNNGNWTYTGATGTQNLLQYKGTGSSSAMLLIYLDANNGNPGVLVGSGSYFPNNLTGSAVIFPYIPTPDRPTQIPLAAVRMDTGTSSITWDNLYDVRQWIHAMPSGTSSGGGGGGIDTIGFVGQNKGIYLATGTVLNVNGSRLTLSVSGTVFNLTNSPDPQELIGIYGMSGTVGLGTGTSISFSNGILASISGTTLYAGLHFGTGTNQVASGDRGVTNGDAHDHLGGDGGNLSAALASMITLADSKNPPVNADAFPINDTESGNTLKRVTLGNLKSFFRTLYDTLYPSVNGWTEVSETWTYASASTINIPSDGTTKYQKSMKIRLKQGGAYKYYVARIVASTLITVIVNTDFIVDNVAITDIAYSFMEKPYGWPDWFNFTGTASGSGSMIWSLTSTTLSKLKVQGNQITYALSLVGTTSGTASNTLQYSVPIAPSVSVAFFSSAATADAGATLGGFGFATTAPLIAVRKPDSSNYGLGANRSMQTVITMEW